MLQENFDSEYLNGIAEKIENMSIQYRELYSAAYTRLEEMSKSSLQTRVVSGLATASKATGQALAKAPVVSKSPVDELLVAVGEKMESHEKQKTQVVLMQLAERQSG